MTAVGLAQAPERDSAILMTEYLAYSIQYRRLLMRFPLGPGPYRDRLLDAMAWLLVDLHRGGVFWGDCSLANTLFRRDGDRIQAFLVDAETSEIHPRLSDGQRAYDLDILVENVGFGLADLGAMQGREDASTTPSTRPRRSGRRYLGVWDELHLEPSCSPGDRHAIRAGSAGSTTSGFAVDEISHGAEPVQRGTRSGCASPWPIGGSTAHELQRLTGIVALEGQARLLLNDLREYGAWLESDGAPTHRGAGAPSAGCATSSSRRWPPSCPAIGPGRDPLQAYCDVLEEKWLLSEAGRARRRARGGDGRVPRARRAGAGGRRPGSPTAGSPSTSTGRRLGFDGSIDAGVEPTPTTADRAGHVRGLSRCAACHPAVATERRASGSRA